MGRGVRWSVVGAVLLTGGTLTACGPAESPGDENAGRGGSLDALRERVEAQRTAHLELNPAMLAAGVADTFLSVDEGRLTRRTRDDVLVRFETYFDGVRYDEWTDLVEPVIEISPDGRMGWVTRRVRAHREEPDPASDGEGTRIRSFVGAWTATYEFAAGSWLMTSVTSTFEPVPAETPAEQVEARNRAALVRWVEDVWNRGDLELAAALLGDRYVRHGSDGTVVSTREEYVAAIADLRSRHDDLVFRIHDIGAERDRAWYRWSAAGVERASGRPIDWSGIQQYRLEDGKLVETWLGTRPDGSGWDDVARD